MVDHHITHDFFFSQENSLKFREDMSDANQAETPVTSSSTIEVNDGELLFEDLSAHSSSVASVS